MEKQLPKRVVFKGENGYYMAAVQPEGTDHVYLGIYVNPKNKTDKRCIQTIHTNSDGTIRIESDYYGKFWRLSPNWIWVDSDDKSSNNRDTLFRLVKLDEEDMYAIKNISSGNYCHRLTVDGKQNCLNANSPSIHKEGRFKLEEAVLSRRIYNVRYRTEDAKTHGKRLNTLITQDVANRGSSDNNNTISLKFTVTRETQWDSSASIKFGVSTTIEAGIPKVSSASIQIGIESTYTQTWGKTVTHTEEHSTKNEVTTPPNAMSVISVVATEAICEVPFSYIQEDTLSTGEIVVYKFDDGIYRGVNSYGFKVDISEKKL